MNSDVKLMQIASELIDIYLEDKESPRGKAAKIASNRITSYLLEAREQRMNKLKFIRRNDLYDEGTNVDPPEIYR